MASISRFGRVISSGNSASDKSVPNRVSVSSAVWSSRLVKSINAVPVIKQSSRAIWPDNPLWHRLRQLREGDHGALKALEKEGIMMKTSFRLGPFIGPIGWFPNQK